jgi:hypothetical protein
LEELAKLMPSDTHKLMPDGSVVIDCGDGQPTATAGDTA